VSRRDLERHLRQCGCVPHHHGGNHDVWLSPSNLAQAPVPRHSHIKRGRVRASAASSLFPSARNLMSQGKQLRLLSAAPTPRPPMLRRSSRGTCRASSGRRGPPRTARSFGDFERADSAAYDPAYPDTGPVHLPLHLLALLLEVHQGAALAEVAALDFLCARGSDASSRRTGRACARRGPSIGRPSSAEAGQHQVVVQPEVLAEGAGSPWRPQRPMSWRSMRAASCISVQITCSPPSLAMPSPSLMSVRVRPCSWRR